LKICAHSAHVYVLCLVTVIDPSAVLQPRCPWQFVC